MAGYPPNPHPPPAQPPVQPSISDPFRNRDPFMPGGQHRREKSYGGIPSAPLAPPPYGAEGAWGGQHAYNHPPPYANAPYNGPRRRSIGAPAAEAFHPPPLPFGHRNMPPPSPSTSSASSFPSQQPPRPPVSTSPYGPQDATPYQSRPNGPLSIGSLVGHEGPPSDDRASRPPTNHEEPAINSNHSSFRPYQSSPTSNAGQGPTGEPAGQRPASQPVTTARHDYPERWQPPPPDREYNAPRPYRDEEEARRAHDQQSYHPAYPPPHRAYTPDRMNSAPPEHSGVESRFRSYGPPTSDPDALSRARRDDEPQPVPRSVLTLSPELNRREGRSSPLPQAVQGAQPRLMGPGRDSSFKNEFGRMFSGLGSGVGGTSTPNGPFSVRGDMTPSRMSPGRYAGMENGGHADSVEGTSMLHNSDRNREDIDAMNGRGTPNGQPSSSKRVKVTHVPHHHHHHAHAHHHHHHHHPPQEEPMPRGGFSTIRFPQNGAQQTHTQSPLHHHHHHIHGTHHHHHVPKSVSPALPEVTVSSREILAEVAQLPRTHLGSSLYQSDISLPPGKRVLVDTRLMFASTANTIPLFEGKENCTFTVRVPREYLAPTDPANAEDQIAGGLEEICKRRALWGSDVYTDDSDVVAAAVHSGWIRGDFGEFNDDVKELFEDGATKPETEQTSLKAKPPHPIPVPTQRDMHITVLILPPLRNYAASTKHHLRSRTWGDNHDGMSFAIHAIDFVDEPRATRFLERGPKALKQRLQDEQRRRREAAESLLGMKKRAAVAV